MGRHSAPQRPPQRCQHGGRVERDLSWREIREQESNE
ncbi:hypothetical protein E2C01_095586 [Portunus trituberculatus]|uniref:Uncharacterized protein n=1 Tax=Portunus trituberculatus TaxID=210409 RepID=A0A5B7JVN5_PORTR|nr:hypothetical protein [Portunus trituberculatus]